MIPCLIKVAILCYRKTRIDCRWYTHTCTLYDVLEIWRPFRESILVSKVMSLGYSSQKLPTTVRKVYGRYVDTVRNFDLCWRVFVHRKLHMLWFQLFYCIVTGATCGTRNAQYFRNTWLRSLWIVHDLTQSADIYITKLVSLCTMFTDYWLCEWREMRGERT